MGMNRRYLAEKLKLSEEEAELWIIDLIRDSKLEAQFDSEKGIVCMETTAPNFHAKVAEYWLTNRYLRKQGPCC